MEVAIAAMLVSAVGQYQQGQTQQKIYNAQAQAAQQQADFQAQQVTMQGRRMQSWPSHPPDSRQISTNTQASKTQILCAHPVKPRPKLVCIRQLAQSARLA